MTAAARIITPYSAELYCDEFNDYRLPEPLPPSCAWCAADIDPEDGDAQKCREGWECGDCRVVHDEEVQ